MRREASDTHATEDLDLAYELQPDGTTDNLSVPLRRSIGLVRLGGDDRNDRDLRLARGSALDRLLSDKGCVRAWRASLPSATSRTTWDRKAPSR